MKKILPIIVLLSILGFQSIQGQIPRTMSYQGVLTTTNGETVPDGSRNLTFKLYDTETGGNALWTETQSVTTTQGIFNVILGCANALNLPFDKPYWLGVTLEGESELTPRMALTASPYSLNSKSVADQSVTGQKIADQSVVRSINTLQDDVTLEGGNNITITQNDQTLTISSTGATGGQSGWSLTGNSGITDGTHFIGTLENAPMNLYTHNQRVFRLEPGDESPNIIGGYRGNFVKSGHFGSTIGGGGKQSWENRITADFGTISGGVNNLAGDDSEDAKNEKYATVGGGQTNRAKGSASTIAGGQNNLTSDSYATISGGATNKAVGWYSAIAGGVLNETDGESAFVGGGSENKATNQHAAVIGGSKNIAKGSESAIGGGQNNTAGGTGSTIAGGLENSTTAYVATVAGGKNNTAGGSYSFAAGYRANAGHDGTFVWGDHTDADFGSTAKGQFLIRATGGVGIGLNDPAHPLDVAGTVQMTGFKMPTNPADGYVLTSDAAGVGTWKPIPTIGTTNGTDWSLMGNSGTDEANHFLGTTDNVALSLKVNGLRALRLEPHADSPNLIGGYHGNEIISQVKGGTIGGGGTLNKTNRITDDYGTISGGLKNQAGNNSGTPDDASYATVGGGELNLAQAWCATIGGGNNNQVTASYSTIGGGTLNKVTEWFSVISGGGENSIGGVYSMIPGGRMNSAEGSYSFAAGRRAKAQHDGSFVWADNTDADFSSTAEKQFLIRAGGGVGIGLDNPAHPLDVAGTAQMTGFKMPTNPADGYVLTSDQAGVGTWQPLPTGGLGGTGTADYIPKFTDTQTMGNSILFQKNSFIGIGTTTPNSPLEVNGTIHATSGGFKFPDGSIQTKAANGTAGDGHSLDAADGTPVDALFVDNDGRVGIGSKTPDRWLYVEDKTVEDDHAAIYGMHNVSDYYGTGVKGVGGYIGVNGIVAPTGESIYYGVYGEVKGGNGTKKGVYGEATGLKGTKYGVEGYAVGNEGSNYGVYGYANGNSSMNYSVYGYQGGSGTSWAGYFDGRVHVTGTLTKGAGAFMIDHPLDPENKTLSHSFVESPDMMNIYNGNVVLDGNGEAWIDLPDWFGALNKDFRYQLTCIGGFAQIYVAEEISNNRFKIAGGSPGLKVSWQVTGIRKDAFAEANRIPVEEEKRFNEKGKYLHPKAFGFPENRSIHFSGNRETRVKK